MLYPLALVLVLFLKNLGLGGPSPDPRPSPSIRSPPKSIDFAKDLARFFQLAWGGTLVAGSPRPSPPPWNIQNLQKILKIQYFLPRTLLKPPATFPELSGSARERSGAAQKVPRGPSLRCPGARARGVRPASKLVPGDFWEPKTIKNL